MRLGVWGDSRFDMEVQKNDYDWRFKDTIFERSDLLAAQDVVDAPEEYVVTCSFYELNLLHDLRPPEGSTYLWSRSMPFDEEGTLDETRVLNWLARFGIGKPVQLHCSGHMPGKDIRTLVDAAQPEILVPIHTNEPKLFKKFHENVKLMSYGDVLQI
jgi:ribonuclease J